MPPIPTLTDRNPAVPDRETDGDVLGFDFPQFVVVERLGQRIERFEVLDTDVRRLDFARGVERLQVGFHIRIERGRHVERQRIIAARFGEQRHEFLHHLQLIERLGERSARKSQRQLQRRTLRIGRRRIAARSGRRTAEELHAQPFERKGAAGYAHLARYAGDGHFLEEHLLQFGIERKIQVARHFERLRRFGGSPGRRRLRGLFRCGIGHDVHHFVQVQQVGLHIETSRKHVAPQQVADVA